jgi:hypothetical protein
MTLEFLPDVYEHCPRCKAFTDNVQRCPLGHVFCGEVLADEYHVCDCECPSSDDPWNFLITKPMPQMARVARVIEFKRAED